MFKSYKYRIYPTKSQEELLNKHFGACRFVYNLALETKQMAYAGSKINLSRYDLQVQLKDLKKECLWLNEINSQSLQVSLMNLDAAYLQFFKGQSQFPKFKNKSSKQSFKIPQNISIRNNKLFVSKFREGINIVLHRQIKGEIRQVTISKTPTGKYFASILCEVGERQLTKKPIKELTAVGIDLGIKSFLVTSDGESIDNPKFLQQSLSKLKYIQCKYSKHKGKRTRKKLALLHEKVANKRKDFLHKVSANLIKNHDSIAIENLNVEKMKQSHLVKSICDAGWGIFVEILKYNAEWSGKNILQIGQFDPSSKTCSSCGWINRELSLNDRKWTCKCGIEHDRDINAAINIKNFALRNNLSVGRRRKNQKELPTLVGALISEAHIE